MRLRELVWVVALTTGLGKRSQLWDTQEQISNNWQLIPHMDKEMANVTLKSSFFYRLDCRR